MKCDRCGYDDKGTGDTAHVCGPVNIKKPKELCLECSDPAAWIRHTQFAGDHPYCDKHARQEKDFGEDDSYTYWTEVEE